MTSDPSSEADGFDFLLEEGTAAGLAARRAVLAGDGVLPDSVREDVLLLVTELVNNAVRHARAAPAARCASRSGAGRSSFGWRWSTGAAGSRTSPHSARAMSPAVGACSWSIGSPTGGE